MLVILSEASGGEEFRGISDRLVTGSLDFARADSKFDNLWLDH
jgi:hypothetical protein